MTISRFTKCLPLILFSLLPSIGFGASYEPSACDATRFQLSCVMRTWGIGGEALYLKPNYSNYNYLGSNTTIGPSTNQESFNTKAFDYNWGFKVNAFFYLTRTLNIDANWYHYRQTTDQNLSDGVNIFGSVFVGNVKTVLQPEWDAVNLEVGQTFGLYRALFIRLFTGLEYANLKLFQNTQGTNTTAGNTTQRTDLSTYEAGGIRAGANLFYNFREKLSIRSTLAAAILTGTQKFRRESFVSAGGGQSNFLSNVGSSAATIAELEARLGISYQPKTERGVEIYKVGWMWTDYINAIQFAGTNTSGRTNTSDFVVQGLYIGLNW